jgi:hypothetical protein
MKPKVRIRTKPKSAKAARILELENDLRPVVSREAIELERQGKLHRVAQLRLDCAKQVEERDNARAEMHKYGNRTWSDKFLIRMHREGKSPSKSLQRIFDDVHHRMVKHEVRIETIVQQIVDLGGSVVVPPLRTWDKSNDSSISRNISFERKTSGPASYRDSIIKRNQHLPNEALCRKLDLLLAQRGDDPSLGLPETWTEKHGVKTYLEAYQEPRTKGLVQALISKAKRDI